MPDRQPSALLRHARLVFDDDPGTRREALKYLDKKATRTPAEAAGVLELLSSVQAPLTPEVDHGVRALLGLLCQTTKRPAVSVIVGQAPGVLGRLAAQLPAGTGSWILAIQILARIGTPESIARWVDCFLSHRAGWGCCNDYEKALSPMLQGRVRHGDVLFPRLLEGLSDPPKRSSIVGLVNAAVSDGALAENPLGEHVGALADMLNPAYLRQAAPGEWEEGADLACPALREVGTPEAIEVLARALDNPHAVVRLKSGRLLAEQSDPRGVEALVAACRSPLTLARAAAILKQLGMGHLVPPEADDPDLKARALVAQRAAFALDRGDGSPDAVSVVARRNLPWPPRGAKETVWVVRYRLPSTEVGEGPSGHAVVAAGSVHMPRLRSNEAELGDFLIYGLSGDAPGLYIPDMGPAEPEDTLAVAYYCELMEQGLISHCDTVKEDPEAPILSKDGLEVTRPVAAVEAQPWLGRGRLRGAVAEASLAGEPGWLLINDAEAAWHPRSNAPEAQPEVLLALHVGRRLLALAGQSGEPVEVGHPGPQQGDA